MAAADGAGSWRDSHHGTVSDRRPALLVLLCCMLMGGCKRGVHYDIDHVLRAVELDRAARTLTLRYEILEREVWQQWPCFAHGCGDSERLPGQAYDLGWQLPAEETGASIPYASFGSHVRPGSRSHRLDVSSSLAYGDGAVRFTEDDHIGRFPVLMYDRLSCWRALPCFIRAPA